MPTRWFLTSNDEAKRVRYLMNSPDEFACGYRALMYGSRGEWDGDLRSRTELARNALASLRGMTSYAEAVRQAMKLADIVSEHRALRPGRPADEWGTPGSLLIDDWVATDSDVVQTSEVRP